MKRSRWILLGSLATLALCAAPYGCSGKYVDSPGQAGSGNVHPGGDGAVVPEGSGYATDGSRGDDAFNCCSDGSSIPAHTEGTFVGGDGAYIPGDGSGLPPVQGDGYDPYYGDGTPGVGDGTSVDYPEGSPNNADSDSTTPEGYAEYDGYPG